MNRYQRVKLANVYSDWESVPSGVPQGTKLGPWLFLLFLLNDIDMWKYVDDTSTSQIIHKGSDSNIQLSSSKLQEWSSQNRFQINS